jgi:hypothetical protein
VTTCWRRFWWYRDWSEPGKSLGRLGLTAAPVQVVGLRVAVEQFVSDRLVAGPHGEFV